MSPTLHSHHPLSPVPRLQTALDCAARGWPVFPLHHPVATGESPRCSCGKAKCRDIGKHPRTQHGFKDATTDPGRIAAWWSKWPEANIGMATGSASGLLVIDVDARHEGFQTLTALGGTHGDLPRTPVCRTGGGGVHMFFALPGGQIRGKLGRGVDVKASGGYVVAAGSLHASGNMYAWDDAFGPSQIEIAALPKAWIALIVAEDCNREDGGRPPIPPECPASPVSPIDPIDPVDPVTIDGVIARCAVTRAGEHDQKTMDLARGLKFNCGLRSTNEARPHFQRWWSLSKPNCSDQDDDEAWFKFTRAWETARIPQGGQGIAACVLGLGDAVAEAPEAANYSSPRTRRAVSLLAEMGRRAQGQAFALSTHQLGHGLNTDATTAHRLLRGFERDGLIRCVDKGKAGRPGRNAGRYMWLGASAASKAEGRSA